MPKCNKTEPKLLRVRGELKPHFIGKKFKARDVKALGGKKTSKGYVSLRGSLIHFLSTFTTEDLKSFLPSFLGQTSALPLH
jgi:hypothetical protein